MFLHTAKRELEMLVGLYRMAIADFDKAIAECDTDDEYMFVADRDALQETLKNLMADLSLVKCLLNN